MLADITHTRAEADTKISFEHSPQAGHLVWRHVRRVAIVTVNRVFETHFVVSVPGDGGETLRPLGMRFQFNALGMHFARRLIVTALHDAVADVFLRQIVQRHGVHIGGANRLIFHARFILLGGGRFQQFAIGTRQNLRRNRLAVTDVRRNAVVEGVK